MANKINFITGETYTLSELFSGERRIIIPDLQRDYCWGNEDNDKGTGEKGELVTDFVNNLLGQFEEYQNNQDKSSLNLGLFYGYEVPANHIQLCDGQQRLTTLYLLLGMINKKTIESKDNQLTEGKFRQHLISDFEYKHDDKEPYLNYAIRESSLYFLSDLVCKFFIGNKDNVESVKSADWYFDCYNLDPSIQSMLKALGKIEKIYEEKSSLEFLEFGEWLLNKVTFLYFDMENRKNGEETFVVINTTGESLSSTQNLKPLVLQEKNTLFDNTKFKDDGKGVDQCWEEIETWFWKNRNKEKNDTADAGFAEFLRWVSIIEQVDKDAPEEEKTGSIKKLIQLILQGKHCDFPYKDISFETIYNYWKALKWIAEETSLSFVKNYLSPAVNTDVKGRNAIGQNDCFVLLPVLRFVYKNISNIESDTTKQRNAKRIYEFFKNLIRIDNVSKAVNTLVGDTIKIVELILAKTGDLIDLIDPSVDVSGISKQLLTEEENRKLEILKNCTNRNVVEEAFWKVQKHNIWSGEILPMIEWATNNGVFDLTNFNKYRDYAYEWFPDNFETVEDSVRRALLACKIDDYPNHYYSGTNLSFGFKKEKPEKQKYNYWQYLIKINKDKFKLFFDELIAGSTPDQIINKFNDSSYKWFSFIKHSELMSYCEQKNIQKWDNSYCLVKQHKATKYLELETFCLYLDYKSISIFEPKIALSKDDGIDYRGWKMWLYEQDSSALVFDKELNGSSVAIDVHFNRTKKDDWDVQLFLRDESADTQKTMENVASSYGLEWDATIERYKLEGLSRENVIEKINALLGMSL